MHAIDLGATQTRTDSTTHLQDLCSTYGFDFAAYAMIQPQTGNVLGCATYPVEWQSRYRTDRLHLIDPTLNQTLHSLAPVEWSQLSRSSGFDAVFSKASDFGITKQGLSVPIRGQMGDFGLLNVTRDCAPSEWRSQIGAVMTDLQLAAVQLHDQMQALASTTLTLTRPALSQRELEILQWVAEGKSQQDIGDILTISHRTVEVHLRSIRAKLGALTTAQAIGRAIGFRLIHPGLRSNLVLFVSCQFSSRG